MTTIGGRPSVIAMAYAIVTFGAVLAGRIPAADIPR